MQEINVWLKRLGWNEYSIEAASSDASLRNYYRVYRENKSYILMDASRQKESLAPFLDIQARLLDGGVGVPVVFAKDVEQGYLLLEDFGSTHLLDLLKFESEEEYYKKAINEIISMQKANVEGLALYDKEFLLFEMNLMEEWYLQKHLNIFLDMEQKSKLDTVLRYIADQVLSQPGGIFVHRDFHSRNIMIKNDGSLGVIDFQDARNGSITYDLASLLKDCYYELDESKRKDLILYFRDQKAIQINDETMIRWVDMMGLQRHIKVLGIFARLYHRDGKEGYLKDIPLTLKYVLEAAAKYPQTKYLCSILK